MAVYRCALEQPVHCGASDQDPRSPEEMCLGEIDTLSTCAEAKP